MAFPSAPEQGWDDEDREAELAVARPSEGLPLTRLEYLRLLVEGYRKDGKQAPREVLDEYNPLATAEATRLAKLAAEAQAARSKAEFERNEAEASLEEFWSNQRQLGKTEAAQRWAERHGVPLPEIIEIAETEEEMLEAIRNLKRNQAAAKRQQGFRDRFVALYDEEPF
jgi:hypothetical protein